MKKFDFISIASVTLFVLSLIYLAAETLFNMSLLDIAGSVKSSPKDIDGIQYFGRTVSAFGCYLLVMGLFLRAKFVLTGQRETRILAVIAFISLLPLLVLMLGHVPHSSYQDSFFSLMPFVGMAVIMITRRRQAYANIAGLFLMVWTTMYTGQKLLIEELLVSQTGWEERVNARYALMLRAGFEGCSMSLEDLQLCDSEGRQDIVKSARIILGALWMLNPDGIRRDMIDNREKLIETAAASGIGGSIEGHYKKYVDAVASKRDGYKKEMIEKYYEPYKRASDLYNENANPAQLRVTVDKAADDIDRKVSDGWTRYTQGVQQYRNTAGSLALNAARSIAPFQEKVQQFCNNRRCPGFINSDTSAMIGQAKDDAELRFMQSSGGYTPDLPSREVFEAHPITQATIRAGIEETIKKRMDIDFTLPVQWRYSREGLHKLFADLSVMQVNNKWKEKFGKVPPNLSPEDFFIALGYPPLPEVSDLVMDQDKFFRTMLLPEYKAKAAAMFDEIEAEKKLYANGESLENKGRDYVRAAYIPAISLVVSLIVVSITLVRWSAVGMALAIKRSGKKVARPVRYGMVAVFVVLLLCLPYLAPNDYIRGTAYQRYLKGAAEQSPVIARILDWAIHAQPVVYRIGTPLRKILD